jgi:hypothetical protein
MEILYWTSSQDAREGKDRLIAAAIDVYRALA